MATRRRSMASLPDPPLGMLSARSSRGRAHPSPSADEAGGGLRRGGLLGGLQEGAEVFQFRDQAVLGGDHLVGAVALALEVRPVTSRTLFGLGQFGFQFGDPRSTQGEWQGENLRR